MHDEANINVLYSTSKRPSSRRRVERIINKLYTSVFVRSNGAVEINYEILLQTAINTTFQNLLNQKWMLTKEKEVSGLAIVTRRKKRKKGLNGSLLEK